MNAEELLERAKFYVQVAKTQRKRAVMTSVTLIAAALISLLFLVYAFIQKGLAEESQALAYRMKLEAEQAQTELSRLKEELKECKDSQE
jgi:hypothetical protein